MDKLGRAFEPDFLLFFKQRKGEQMTFQVFYRAKRRVFKRTRQMERRLFERNQNGAKDNQNPHGHLFNNSRSVLQLHQ